MCMCNVDWLISISDELVGIWFVIGAIFLRKKRPEGKKPCRNQFTISWQCFVALVQYLSVILLQISFCQAWKLYPFEKIFLLLLRNYCPIKCNFSITFSFAKISLCPTKKAAKIQSRNNEYAR